MTTKISLAQILAIIMVWMGTLAYDMQTPANAQWCSVSAGNVDFGTVDLSSGAAVNTTTTLSVFCIGSPGRTVRICPNYNSGIGGASPGGDPRQMLSGINQLNYNIYKNSGYSQVWGSHVWGWAPTPPTINITLSGGWWLGWGSTTFVMRGRIGGGQSATPAGLYTSSFSGSQTRVSYRYASAGNCAAISSFGGVQTPFTVRANVLTTCTVNATNMNFGSTGLLGTNVDSSNIINVNCNSGLPYTIGLDGGLSGAPSPALRQMVNGGDQVTYGIYQNAGRTIPWGDSIGTNTISSVGTGLNQVFTAFGRVPPQTTPPPATYTDTVVVTVTY
ncbi:MAG: spore coat U domain-containing protein [Rhizobiaceae bacterium]|nr:spore coat U domain-containing protein [Rhizobiaceae bacterium]